LQLGGEGGGTHEEQGKTVEEEGREEEDVLYSGEEGGANIDQGKTDDNKDGEEEDLLYDGDEYWELPVPEQTGMEMDVDEPHTSQQGEPELYKA
jgi:hypothetical protein